MDYDDLAPANNDNVFDQSNVALIQNAPLHGNVFNSDNYDLFQILTTWTSGGTAESYVDHFKRDSNGRHAWLRLL